MQTSARAPRRRRPHPARRARRLAGATSVAGVFVLTGCMAATSKTASIPVTSVTATTPTTATSSRAAAAAAATSTSTGSAATAAQAGTVSAQANTSSHGS